MRQVLWNLVRNAMQVSKAGDEVRVSVRKDDSGDALLTVTDSGPGIPDSTREHLFDAFVTTRSKGAGIGLAVVKQLTDGHGFSIDVDSGAGSGTTFTVRIPKIHLLLLLCGCTGSGFIREGRYHATDSPEHGADVSPWDEPAPSASAASD
jgi:nitrogen-specific signal transduction histidine kinase